MMGVERFELSAYSLSDYRSIHAELYSRIFQYINALLRAVWRKRDLNPYTEIFSLVFSQLNYSSTDLNAPDMIRTYTSQINNLEHYQLCYRGLFFIDLTPILKI